MMMIEVVQISSRKSLTSRMWLDSPQKYRVRLLRFSQLVQMEWNMTVCSDNPTVYRCSLFVNRYALGVNEHVAFKAC
jgi:hypothetical protein